MQIFVSPDFQDPKPYVDIIHAVADRYSERMIHKSIIQGKLATLELYLNLLVPTEEDYKALEERKAAYAALGDAVPRIIYDKVMNDTMMDVLESGGYHQTMFEDNQVYSKIVLYVHPEENYKQFANLVAHEMTHMLVCDSFNLCSIGAPEECGSIPGLSGINRWIPESETSYGEYMEEIAVHAVAEWLVRDLDLPAEPVNSDRTYWAELSQVDLCNILADAFGTPISQLRYLDEFSIKEDRVAIPNMFWYCFAVNRFGWVISVFDEVMGENAYRQLCCYLDAKTDEDEEKAREMMRSFEVRYQQVRESETM